MVTDPIREHDTEDIDTEFDADVPSTMMRPTCLRLPHRDGTRRHTVADTS